jgi:hypothetical protein
VHTGLQTIRTPIGTDPGWHGLKLARTQAVTDPTSHNEATMRFFYAFIAIAFVVYFVIAARINEHRP